MAADDREVLFSRVLPVVIDLGLDDDDTIRSKAQQGLSSPAAMFALRNHGLEGLIQRVRDSTRTDHQLDHYARDEKCVSCELTDDLAAALKQGCREVAGRLCETLFGGQFMANLKGRGSTLDGRQSMRYYPGSKALGGEGGVALGPHVDNTLFTMLWADGPGLQVISRQPTLHTWRRQPH